jgi:hypothetical protein
LVREVARGWVVLSERIGEDWRILSRFQIGL